MFNFTAIEGNSTSYFYIGLYDKMIKNTYELSQNPLFSATSQLTGKTKNFLPFVMDSTNYERYYKFEIRGVENEIPPIFYPVTGFIDLGNQDFPFGFYDIKIYQNDPGYPTNVDPSTNTIALLYTGLLNVIPAEGVNDAVNYNEYTTNDSDTTSVYITN
tara:strand:+ start:4521 stop:4997 length:477 start_codon:yes stop_codon:yes gene_type:complete